MSSILELLYPADQIFVHNPRFHPDQPIVEVTCLVPSNLGYTLQPIPYVTAENYVRILSQSCCLLAYYAVENRLIKIDISTEDFLRAMTNFELYYRNLAMTFHCRSLRGEPFEMELELKDVREIKRLHDFIIFTFANKRTVISGEMSFIYVS